MYVNGQELIRVYAKCYALNDEAAEAAIKIEIGKIQLDEAQIAIVPIVSVLNRLISVNSIFRLMLLTVRIELVIVVMLGLIRADRYRLMVIVRSLVARHSY